MLPYKYLKEEESSHLIINIVLHQDHLLQIHGIIRFVVLLCPTDIISDSSWPPEPSNILSYASDISTSCSMMLTSSDITGNEIITILIDSVAVW